MHTSKIIIFTLFFTVFTILPSVQEYNNRTEFTDLPAEYIELILHQANVVTKENILIYKMFSWNFNNGIEYLIEKYVNPEYEKNIFGKISPALSHEEVEKTFTFSHPDISQTLQKAYQKHLINNIHLLPQLFIENLYSIENFYEKESNKNSSVYFFKEEKYANSSINPHYKVIVQTNYNNIETIEENNPEYNVGEIFFRCTESSLPLDYADFSYFTHENQKRNILFAGGNTPLHVLLQQTKTDKIFFSNYFINCNHGTLSIIPYLLIALSSYVYYLNNPGEEDRTLRNIKTYIERIITEEDNNQPNNEGYYPLDYVKSSFLESSLQKQGMIHSKKYNQRWYIKTITKLLLLICFLYGAQKGIYYLGNHTKLHQAAANNDLEAIKTLLTDNCNLNTQDFFGKTPLFLAVEYNHIDAVKLLIEHGADVNSTQNYGCAPLNYASEKGYFDIVKLLLDHGADVNTAQYEGPTPLGNASSNGHLNIAKLLLEHGADVNKTNNEKKTPLYNATYNNNIDIVKLLLEHGADINIALFHDWTPLNRASYDGYFDIVKLLLEHGADVNKTDYYGDSPLYNAKNKEIKELLIKYGAKNIHNFAPYESSFIKRYAKKGLGLLFTSAKFISINTAKGLFYTIQHGIGKLIS